MKYRIIAMLCCLFTALAGNAQDKEKEGKTALTITTDGISIDKDDEKSFEVDFGGFDFGINSLNDNSDYNSTAAQELLQVPDDYRNASLFNLRSGKSWNVNFWPVLAKWRILNSNGQKIYLGSGIGLQMYNFRFTKPVTYTNEVRPAVYLDSLNTIAKNKLGFTYLSVPLMLTFKTKAAEDTWIVYGFGVTGGYRLSSHVKQVSTEQGKRKNHDKFNFSDFNSCITAEVGLEGYFRLYASYQLTPLAENALDQRPFSIGLRFGGV